MIEILAWIPLAAAGISALGSLAGGMLSSSGAAQSNSDMMRFNAQEAQRNREWQERMSNTAYQRAMADMRAAGLNPILAYQQGGSSTPSGSSASATLQNTMEGLGKGVTSAGGAAAQAIELQNVRADTTQKGSTTALNEATADMNKASTMLRNQETITSAATAANYNANTQLTMEQMKNPEALRALQAAQATNARSQARLNDIHSDQIGKVGPNPYARTGIALFETLRNAFKDRGAQPGRPYDQDEHDNRRGNAPPLQIDINRR